MRAIQVTCPRCGAALRVGDGDRDVTCEYCGAVAQVQRRSRVFERVLPLAMRAAAQHAMPVAVQQRTRHGLIVAAVVALVIVGALVAAGVAVHHQVQQRRDGITAWQGTGAALLVDVDGDGTLDVVGRSRQLGGPDTCAVVALDGATGRRLWITAPLGTYEATYQGVLALAGDHVVYASPGGEVTAFAVVSGERRWSIALAERSKAFCGPADGALVAIGSDGVRRPLRLADGQPTAEEASATPCSPAPHDGDDGDPRSLRAGLDPGLAKGLGLPRKADLITGASGQRVVVTRRPKGTKTPQLIGLGDDDAIRWTVDVAADPMAAKEQEPRHVALDDRQVCAIYELTRSQARPRLACFELADGRRAWDVELGHAMPIAGVQLTPTMVLASTWNLVEAFDPATGKRLWRYGATR